MKGIIKQISSEPIPENELKLAEECLILGITGSAYYILDESNRVITLIKDWVEITDYEQPDFWVHIDGGFIPEEWRAENFMLLYDIDLYEEWHEIWIKTQFAKGLSKFNLPTVPVNYQDAFDNKYKKELVSTYLQLACDYDNLVSGNMRWNYSFGYFRNDIECFRWNNSEPQYFTKKLLSDQISGFEALKEILKQIGLPFEHANLKFDAEQLEIIRNRVLFSIWSLFGTKNFDVYKLVNEGSAEADYMIQSGDQCYLLSYDYVV